MGKRSNRQKKDTGRNASRPATKKVYPTWFYVMLLVTIAVIIIASLLIAIGIHVKKQSYGVELGIPNPDNMSEIFELDLVFEANAFSAQNSIDVTAVMSLNKTYVQQNPKALSALSPTFYLSFLGASPSNEIASPDYLPGTARIDLKLDESTFAYRGNTAMVYPVEGDYSVRLTSSIPDKFISRPSEDQMKVIHISSIDSTYAIRNNNLILALTVAGIELATAQLITSIIKPKIAKN